MTAATEPNGVPTGIEGLDWSFGDRLRKVRKRRTHLGQREFAKQLGVGWQAYAQWEADNSRPKDIVAVARRVELLTGAPAAWLLGVYDTPAATPDTPRTDAHNEALNLLEGSNYGPSLPPFGGRRRRHLTLLPADLTTGQSESPSVMAGGPNGQATSPDLRSVRYGGRVTTAV
jgi:DNA-binding XRE family transcriptional regulator